MAPDELHARLSGLGLTPPEFAAWLGTSRGTVYRWIGGERKIPTTVVRVIELLEERQRIAGAVAKLPA